MIEAACRRTRGRKYIIASFSKACWSGMCLTSTSTNTTKLTCTIIINYFFLCRFVDDDSVFASAKSSLHKNAANGFPIKIPKATIATHNAIAGIECIGINPKKKHSSSVKLNVTPSCGNFLYPFVGTTFEESTETLAYALLLVEGVVSKVDEEEEEEEEEEKNS